MAATLKSGQENGGWAFVDINSGDLFIYEASEGRIMRNRITSFPAMPEADRKFKELQSKLRQSAPTRRQVFVLFFHTHPGRSGTASSFDQEAVMNWGAGDGMGVVIHGSGQYAPFNRWGNLSLRDPRRDKCLP